MKVLIIEDETIFADVLQSFMDKENIESKVTANIAEAWIEIENNVDLVLIDYTCIDIFQFLNHVCNFFDLEKIIVMGGNIDKTDRAKLNSYGIINILDKPFSLKALTEKIPNFVFAF